MAGGRLDAGRPVKASRAEPYSLARAGGLPREDGVKVPRSLGGSRATPGTGGSPRAVASGRAAGKMPALDPTPAAFSHSGPSIVTACFRGVPLNGHAPSSYLFRLPGRRCRRVVGCTTREIIES